MVESSTASNQGSGLVRRRGRPRAVEGECRRAALGLRSDRRSWPRGSFSRRSARWLENKGGNGSDAEVSEAFFSARRRRSRLRAGVPCHLHFYVPARAMRASLNRRRLSSIRSGQSKASTGRVQFVAGGAVVETVTYSSPGSARGGAPENAANDRRHRPEKPLTF